MTRVLDGLNFSMPPTHEEIMVLAHQHREALEQAIFHHDIHMGDFCLAQRKRVYDFTRELDKQQRLDFYNTYNGELERIADEDQLHPAHAEKGVSIFAIILALGIIALILFFAFIRSTIF